jgi:hypothetical protein
MCMISIRDPLEILLAVLFKGYFLLLQNQFSLSSFHFLIRACFACSSCNKFMGLPKTTLPHLARAYQLWLARHARFRQGSL